MKIEPRSELLRQITLFSSLTTEELNQVFSKVNLKKFRKNEVILYEEDTSEFMYFIISGKVKVTQSTEDGKEVILAMHSEGDSFGEMSLIDGKTTPARVYATEESVTALISKKDFYALLMHSKVMEKMLYTLCARLREAWSKIQILTFNNASQRVKMLLFMLSEKYGEKKDRDVRLNIKFTHQDIAEMSGLTRETVTRVLDRWQKDGDILLENKIISLTERFFKNH